MNRLASSKVYEPSALAIISFALTWAAIAAIQWFGQGAQARVAGPR